MKENETSSEQVSGLLQRQKVFFETGKTRDLEGRLRALKRFEKAFTARQEDLMQALAEDLGKPEFEAYLSEYLFLLQEVRLIQKSLKRWLRPRRVGSPIYFMPCRNEVRLEPHGQVLIIAPWNYPVQLALAPLLGAVAAGNTVLLKPSEEAPACAAFLEELVRECFDADWVEVVTGGVEVTSSLLEYRFDFLFFTGSSRVGKIVAAKTAHHLTPSVLELGGKCPCVVDSSANLAIAARRILIGKLFNAGQTCFAPDFIAVQASVRDTFLRELKQTLEAHPWEEELASIINEKNYQRLLKLCQKAGYQKGEDAPELRHLAPRLVELESWEDEVMQEEIFGPILPIVSYEEPKDLFEKLAQFSEPLALYCFSKDEGFISELVARIPSGGVCVNDVGKQATNLKLPFGGKGESGYGRYRGKETVKVFSYERSYSRRYLCKDWFESLPPRGPQMEIIRKWMK